MRLNTKHKSARATNAAGIVTSLQQLSPGWHSPYTVKASRFFWLFFHYAIMFEGDPLFYCSDWDEAVRLCAYLNGAYNLGRSSAFLELLA